MQSISNLAKTGNLLHARMLLICEGKLFSLQDALRALSINKPQAGPATTSHPFLICFRCRSVFPNTCGTYTPYLSGCKNCGPAPEWNWLVEYYNRCYTDGELYASLLSCTTHQHPDAVLPTDCKLGNAPVE